MFFLITVFWQPVPCNTLAAFEIYLKSNNETGFFQVHVKFHIGSVLQLLVQLFIESSIQQRKHFVSQTCLQFFHTFRLFSNLSNTKLKRKTFCVQAAVVKSKSSHHVRHRQSSSFNPASKRKIWEIPGIAFFPAFAQNDL
jgi:hypothetical protein